MNAIFQIAEGRQNYCRQLQLTGSGLAMGNLESNCECISDDALAIICFSLGHLSIHNYGTKIYPDREKDHYADKLGQFQSI